MARFKQELAVLDCSVVWIVCTYLGIVQFSQTLHRDELFVESTRQHEGADAFAYMG